MCQSVSQKEFMHLKMKLLDLRFKSIKKTVERYQFDVHKKLIEKIPHQIQIYS